MRHLQPFSGLPMSSDLHHVPTIRIPVISTIIGKRKYKSISLSYLLRPLLLSVRLLLLFLFCFFHKYQLYQLASWAKSVNNCLDALPTSSIRALYQCCADVICVTRPCLANKKRISSIALDERVMLTVVHLLEIDIHSNNSTAVTVQVIKLAFDINYICCSYFPTALKKKQKKYDKKTNSH